MQAFVDYAMMMTCRRVVLCDAVSTQPHVTDDDEGGDNPCIEDEEFFQGRPDDDDMEEQ
jgi:hypothetical protein